MKLYLASGPPQKQKEQAIGQQLARDIAMKTHLVDSDIQHHAWATHGEQAPLKLRILLSYHYYKTIDLDRLFEKYFTQPYPDVFADSGAFSAMTQGVEISVREYAEWVQRWKHLFSAYSNLDVIKDAEATLRNQKQLEDDFDLTPLPVFHVLEEWRWLEQYIEQYSYIALGVAGMQQRTRPMMAWLTKCFQMAGERSVYHGFALTSWKVMKAFRWYSVDSSSWGQGFRYGSVPVFDQRKGSFIKLKLGSQEWYQRGRLIRSLGFEPADFADRDRNDRAKICAISALSYMMAERWLRNYHGLVKIPSSATPKGFRAHRADANPKRFSEAVSQLGTKLHLSDTAAINLHDAANGTKIYQAEVKPDLGDIKHAAKKNSS